MSLMMVLVALIGNAFAKNPCAGVKVEEDAFTHQQTSTTTAAIYPESPTATGLFRAVFTAGKTDFSVRLPLRGLHEEILAPGTKLLVLMKDNSVIELITTEEIKPEIGGTSMTSTDWQLLFHLDRALASQFAMQPIAALRVALPGGDTTWSMTAKVSKAMSRAFGCYASLMV